MLTHLATSIMLMCMRHDPRPTRLLSLFLLLLRLLLLPPRRLLLAICDTLRHRARRPSRDAANDACHRPKDSAADDGRSKPSEEPCVMLPVPHVGLLLRARGGLCGVVGTDGGGPGVLSWSAGVIGATARRWGVTSMSAVGTGGHGYGLSSRKMEVGKKEQFSGREAWLMARSDDMGST